MKVSLMVIGGSNNGQVIDIAQPEVLIGRDPKCNIQLQSEDVSRQHCLLYLEDKKVMLRDSGSSNGTFVNKRRMRGELELQDGDTIQVGPQLFAVGIETEPQESEDDADFNVLDDPAEQEDSDSKTIVGNVRIIDPNHLESSEESKLDDRLKDL